MLVGAVKRQHVAHAQLLAGPEGSAKLALALAYATFLNCEDRQETDSCGRCASCVKMNKLIHPDLNFVMPVTTTKKEPKDPLSQKFLADWREFVLGNPYQTLNDWMQFIGAENKQGSISKDESRQLIRLISLKAFEGAFKIIIIWLPELMHPAAANALLKSLEEPPPNTIFLLVTESLEKLLATIVSRTQVVQVRPFTDEEVAQWLLANGINDETAAYQLAQLAEGNLQAARQLSQEAGSDYFAFFTNWLRLCYQHRFDKVVEASDDFQKLGRENQKNFLQYALTLFRKVLLYGVGAELVPTLLPSEADFVQKFSKLINLENAGGITEELNQAHYHIERNANPKMVFVDVSMHLADLLNPK